MNVQNTVTVQRGSEIMVPLNKLKKSPKNARKTAHAISDVEALAASIRVKGLLQPPVVEPEVKGDEATGFYLVTIGEGRRLALNLLAKQKVFTKSEPVRCLLDEANDAFEISLDENVTRFAMHPADQFEAFQKLAEQKGWSADEIGARFGVSAQIVRQRLRLAVVSPVLMAAYRADEVTLDQLMAFAVSEDHARQEQVYASLSYNRSASFIRKAMTEHEVEARDARAVYVGAEAYQEAGGRVRRDLFGEDQGGWFEDVALLDRLVLDKLTAEAEAVGVAEGWMWATVHVSYPHDHGLRRIHGRTPQRDEAEAARLSALGDEYDAMIANCDEDDLTEQQAARLAEIDAVLNAASEPVFDEALKTRAGVFVVLDPAGVAQVVRAFVRPEDEPPPPTGYTDDGAREDGERERSVTDTRSQGLPDKLVADLTAHRTGALRDQVAKTPGVALLVALHAMVLQLFDHYDGEACAELRAVSTDLSRFAEGFDDSPAGLAIAVRHEDWGRQLPEDAADLWGALLDFDETARSNLFAHCVSLTINGVRTIGSSPRVLGDVDRLATHLRLDMSAYWRPTAERYFGRISKAHILDVVREAISPEAAQRLEGLKKDAMAKAATDLLGPEGWLPPLLQTAAAPSA